MTEPEKFDDEKWTDDMRPNYVRWARREARRDKLARWCAIPYSASAALSGIAMGVVLNHGMRWTFAALVVGYLSLSLLLLRRGEDAS